MPASDPELSAALTRSMIIFERTFNDVLENQAQRMQAILVGVVVCGLLCALLFASSLVLLRERSEMRLEFETVTEELRGDIEKNRAALETVLQNAEGGS